MQLQPTEFPQDLTTNQAQLTSPDSHHGYYHGDVGSSLPHPGDSGGGGTGSALADPEEQPRADDEARSSSHHSSRRLKSEVSGRGDSKSGVDMLKTTRSASQSPTFNKAGSPVGRVAEYERDSTPPPKSKEHGIAFKVVPRQKHPNQSDVNVNEFPNEVLTHIFSHLPPATLSAVALVSRRFHSLVTTPHPWRDAFSRYFPGPESLPRKKSVNHEDTFISAKRHFTRLTALASWRSEYILRTRLLRSLARGKPSDWPVSGSSESARSNPANARNAQLTYCSRLFTTVNHLHGTFGNEPQHRSPKFIHGAEESGSASLSNSLNGNVDSWGFGDPESFLQFAERFPGDAQYGLGPGNVVGVPNSMDVSQPYGMIHGEGSPGGSVFYRSTEEQRGRLLPSSGTQSFPELGIPTVDSAREAICSVWIAKSSSLPAITDGLIGLMAGSSSGILTSYSLGTDGLRGRRLERGEVTARWVLSPGVPIIAIAVDEDYNLKRRGQGRVWAVVMNALGEIFYISELPKRSEISAFAKLSVDVLDRFAWEAGRTAFWSLVEHTKRVAKIDPYDSTTHDQKLFPRSSWDGMGKKKEQIAAETRDIETLLKERPNYFQSVCEGWDMRRRLDVDFAGDDDNGAGEAVFVFDCGLEESGQAQMKRFTRLKVPVKGRAGSTPSRSLPASSPRPPSTPSLFGSMSQEVTEHPIWSFSHPKPTRKSSVYEAEDASRTERTELWVASDLSFGDLKPQSIMCTATDNSLYALRIIIEDPLLNMTSSNASSPWSSPAGNVNLPGKPSEIAGHRSRFIAAGTKLGNVIIWNMRAPTAASNHITNSIEPVRIIFTDSPEISSLALSALYLVHGGNDGLVQAWDPLASSTQPLRTLNKRYSSRARDRLHQAVAATPGVGISMFAAGAVCLDPDPTVLRGMVSLGKNLRYWSYSSTAADQYKSRKRRLRRSQRSNNQTGDGSRETGLGNGRGNIRNYISSEQSEHEFDEELRRREAQRLAGRFGLDLLGHGATEEEIMAYATMLSEEAAESDRANRTSAGSLSSDTVPEAFSSPAAVASSYEAVDNDDDIAEAIRLSLQETAQVPVRYAKGRKSPSNSPPAVAGSSRHPEEDDLVFALQLSLAEQHSRAEAQEDFPILSRSSSEDTQNKGKGKERRRC